MSEIIIVWGSRYECIVVLIVGMLYVSVPCFLIELLLMTLWDKESLSYYQFPDIFLNFFRVHVAEGKLRKIQMLKTRKNHMFVKVCNAFNWYIKKKMLSLVRAHVCRKVFFLFPSVFPTFSKFWELEPSAKVHIINKFQGYHMCFENQATESDHHNWQPDQGYFKA